LKIFSKKRKPVSDLITLITSLEKSFA